MTKRTYPDCVIFDLDGTAIRAHPAIAYLSSRADFHGVNLQQAAALPFLAAKKLSPRLGPAGTRLFENFKNTVAQTSFSTLTGVRGVLDELSSQNVPLILASNSISLWGRAAMRQQSLYQYFNAAIFREDVSQVKPDPAGIRNLVEHQNLQPGDYIWVVGDRRQDVRLAQNLQFAMPDIYVDPVALIGTRAALEIQTLQPDRGVTFDTYEDMLFYLQEARQFKPERGAAPPHTPG